MKVLHVHQIAHIPQLLVNELKKNGIEADFIEQASADTIKNYDIIHGHYALNRHTIDAFKLARKNKIPFIMHCHGSDLRLLSGTERKKLPWHYKTISQYIRKRSSKILLSTPDLTEFEPRGIYIPNPIDLNFFRPMPEVEKTGRNLIMGKLISGSKILKHIKPEIQYDCVNNGEKIQWPDNVKTLDYIPYELLPEFFNGYENMIGTMGDLISMARLEAMACGLNTFTDFDEKFKSFYDGQSPDNIDNPRQFIKQFHAPEIAAEKLIEIYHGIKLP
ncbi:MAG: hypothetical protein KAJ19_14615 [Gammaproteobacteria bacterium]|nr:hypothetical protein [Gammaproteobacteria bacterium]